MNNSFEYLIEKFGVPKIIIPNKAQHVTYADRTFSRRFKHGESEFLAVSVYMETDWSRENELLEHLKTKNLKPITYIYSYKKFRLLDPSASEFPLKVAIASDADITPVSRAELLSASAGERLIWVYDWSSMGDSYLHFCHCSLKHFPDIKNVDGFHFLFDEPHRIPSAFLVGIGENFERGDDILDYCARQYFTRSF